MDTGCVGNVQGRNTDVFGGVMCRNFGTMKIFSVLPCFILIGMNFFDVMWCGVVSSSGKSETALFKDCF